MKTFRDFFREHNPHLTHANQDIADDTISILGTVGKFVARRDVMPGIRKEIFDLSGCFLTLDVQLVTFISDDGTIVVAYKRPLETLEEDKPLDQANEIASLELCSAFLEGSHQGITRQAEWNNAANNARGRQ